ncbi:MAG: DEAD/DEAH box helicase, partial [Jatrophihabitans sp.]
AEELESRGFAVGSVHGDLGQGAREQALRAFRSGKVGVLVATDVAARGLDVEGITHVINYQAPEDEMTYIHRIGRTARAGASGTAVTLVDWDDIPRWGLINAKLQLPFADPAETYSTSANLYADLNIPSEATGVLPRSQRTRAGLDAEEIEDLGGRSGGRDGARPARRGEHGDKPRGERPVRTRDRQRSRTRGGHPVDAAAAAGADQSPVADDATRPATAKRRRRRRRPAGSGGGAATPAPAAE